MEQIKDRVKGKDKKIMNSHPTINSDGDILYCLGPGISSISIGIINVKVN